MVLSSIFDSAGKQDLKDSCFVPSFQSLSCSTIDMAVVNYIKVLPLPKLLAVPRI